MTCQDIGMHHQKGTRKTNDESSVMVHEAGMKILEPPLSGHQNIRLKDPEKGGPRNEREPCHEC